MRGPQRAVTAGLTTLGLVATLGVTAAPSTAQPAAPGPGSERKSATVDVSVKNRPAIGGKCAVTFSLRTEDGYVRDSVRLQKRASKKERWQDVRRYRSSATSTRTVQVRAWKSLSFRVLHEATAKVGRAASTDRCVVSALGPGSAKKPVRLLQKRLRRLGVRPVVVNGRYDANTSQAVMAFQKHRKLPRTGRADVRTWVRVANAKRYKGPKWCRDKDTICIDVSKQVAYLRTPAHKRPFIIPVSTGNETYFRSPSGGTDFANTPRGRYKVWLKKPGMTNGDLGTYYWFSAFHRGWGVHGSNSVPAHPASHGCVRVPRSIEKWVYKNLPVGSYVRVHD